MLNFEIVIANKLPEEWQNFVCQSNEKSFGWSPVMTLADFELDYANYLICDKDREPIAYIAFHDLVGEYEIIQVYVKEIYRQQGLGLAMLRRLQRQFNPLFLEVRAQNEPAIKLYNACQFEMIGRRKDYYRLPTDDAIIMRWDREEVEE